MRALVRVCASAYVRACVCCVPCPCRMCACVGSICGRSWTAVGREEWYSISPRPIRQRQVRPHIKHQLCMYPHTCTCTHAHMCMHVCICTASHRCPPQSRLVGTLRQCQVSRFFSRESATCRMRLDWWVSGWMDGWMDGPVGEWMDGWIVDGWVDGLTDGPIDVWMRSDSTRRDAMRCDGMRCKNEWMWCMG